MRIGFLGIKKSIFTRNLYENYLLTRVSRLSTDHSKFFLRDKYNQFTFKRIDTLSKHLSANLLKTLRTNDLQGAKIGVYCANNYTYLISLLAIWYSNGTPICLSKLYPLNYLEYFLNDSKCKLVINSFDDKNSLTNETTLKLAEILEHKKVHNFLLNEHEFFKSATDNDNESSPKIDLKNFSKNSEALVLYTSGTSGPPKGVVLTFNNLISSMEIMKDAWKWSNKDCMLSTLPLNHYSGLVYCLLTPFYVGAHVDLMSKFNAKLVWSKLLDEQNPINMFIGVPTIFTQMINYAAENKIIPSNNNSDSVSEILKRKLRIIGSGSAPLNVKTYNDWFNLTDYKILERYGMTEIGMALSNPYIETDRLKRVGGTVGRPYGEIKVRLVDEITDKVQVMSHEENDFYYDKASTDKTQIFGELQVSGPIVFKEYYNKRNHTDQSFTKDGWFKTGDTAQFLHDSKIYKIVGRTSVDVIKSGGYKISALDIEKELLAHPQIEDVAVMGMKDSVWGQRVFSLLVLKDNIDHEFNEENFKKWCSERLPKYSVPTIIKTIDKLPRNLMGKVNKKEVIKNYENTTASN